MSDSFYRAFEDRYRGSRDLIKDRLTAYRPFVSPLLDIYHPAAAIDLGCGRGEWLELLSAWGFTAKGIDLDVGMLSAAQELGFEVVHGDAIAHLTGQAYESTAIVSAFHLVEHLPFDDLRRLIEEALRVLKPGGLLIMETPNPENIVVATRNFYLDPTHQKPIPSDLLAFAAEHAGFYRVKTVRLQESKRLLEKTEINLLDAIGGASPDYAVVAQKEAPAEILSRFDEAFSRDYGLSQDTLLNRFDAHLHTLLGKIEAKAQQAEAKAQQAEAKAQKAEAASYDYVEELHSVYNSTSWRVTAPLRRFSSDINKILVHRISSLVAAFKQLAKRETYELSTASIVHRSKMRQLVKKISFGVAARTRPYPTIHRFLKRFAEYARFSSLVHDRSQSAPSLPPKALVPRTIEKRRVGDIDIKSVRNALGGLEYQKILIIRGDINSYSGYAKACRLYRTLLSPDYDVVAGVDIHYHPKTFADSWGGKQITADQLHILCSAGIAEVDVLTVSSPQDFVKYQGARSTGLFFWETDRVGRLEWIDAMNNLDEVLVPTRFMMDGLRREGVKTDIKLLKMPLSKEQVLERANSLARPEFIWKIGRRGEKAIKVRYADIPERKFKLLTINTFIGRKGYPVLFSELSRFECNHNFCLVVKTSSVDVRHDEEYLVGLIERYVELMDIKIDIFVAAKKLSEAEMSGLENDCDAFVTCSYGEGFGLGLFEMYHAGKPVICGRHSAFAEYLPPDYRYFMECRHINVSITDPVDAYPISARWAVPVEGELVRVLERILSDQQSGVGNDR